MKLVLLLGIFLFLIQSSIPLVLSFPDGTAVFLSDKRVVVADKGNRRRLLLCVVDRVKPENHVPQLFSGITGRTNPVDSTAHHLVNIHSRIVTVYYYFHALRRSFKVVLEGLQFLCTDGQVERLPVRKSWFVQLFPRGGNAIDVSLKARGIFCQSLV